MVPRVPGFRWSAEITEALRGPRAQGNGDQSRATTFSAAELVAIPVGSSPSTRIKGSVSKLVDEECSLRVWWRSDLLFESIPHLFAGLPEIPLHLVDPSAGSLVDPVLSYLGHVLGFVFVGHRLSLSKISNGTNSLSGICTALINRSCTSEHSLHTSSNRQSAAPISCERMPERCHGSPSGICLDIGDTHVVKSSAP